jgi:catechol 2,3-dioxygenase-like lactoylglutathione lyase family enzyme/oligoribonuclease (3'-5' exoribonuclease)
MALAKTSRVEICVSNFEQSITWFEDVLGFHVVTRNTNEYAELSCGETSIQLVTDHVPYWKTEHLHLLPPGQRGSGIELILPVDDVDAVYARARQAQADIVHKLTKTSQHTRQFWIRHPDGYLIRPTQAMIFEDLATTYSQINKAFRRDVPRATDGLRPIKEDADRLAQQGDYLEAAEIYGALIEEIFEQSHLYHDEEYDDEEYDEDEHYYPEEYGLEDFVKECIQTLGDYLAGEQADSESREKILEILFAIYQQDLQADDYKKLGFATSVADQVTKLATLQERLMVARWIHDALADEEEEATSSQRKSYGDLLLELEKDTLDDEAYLRICHETEHTSELIDRLLTLDRVDEAMAETQHMGDYALLKYIDLFIQHGQDALAERVVKEHLKAEEPSSNLLAWLQKYYRTRDNSVAELQVTQTLFRTWPSLSYYQELRTVAQKLDRWETLRPELLAFVEQKGKTTLLIEIAINEEEIDKALELLKKLKKTGLYGYSYTSGYTGPSIELAVARAAKKTHPHEAIQIYQQRAERLIAEKSRKSYQGACTQLVEVKSLYKERGEYETWDNYISSLRQQYKHLPALRDEMMKAGL